MDRRKFLGILSASIGPAILLGLPGCGPESNEAEIKKTHGSAPPDAPKTAEEYEARYNKGKRKDP